MIGMPVTVENEILEWLKKVGKEIALHNTLGSKPQAPYFAAAEAIKQGDPQPALELFVRHRQEAVSQENLSRYERFIYALSQPNASFVGLGE